MVCNWILPQFNYMARSLLHPNLILSDFLLGMLASGLVVYIPREACLEGALASGLFSSSWLLELPGQRLWGSPPRPWPRSPLQWTPHWGHSGWALALAREPSHEHPVQPALVAGHPILTSILRCWVPPPLRNLICCAWETTVLWWENSFTFSPCFLARLSCPP